MHKGADIGTVVGIPDEELVIFEDVLYQLFVDLFDYLAKDDAEEEIRVCSCDLLEDLLYEGLFFFEFYDHCLQDGLYSFVSG